MGTLRGRVNRESPEAILDGGRLLSRMATTTAAICNETDLTVQQYRMLLKIVDGPMRAGALARRSGLTRATLSTIIRNLEQRGFVTRAAVEEDARGVAIDLTAAGKAAVDAVDERMARLLVDLASETGVRKLLELLDLLRAPLDREATAYKQRNLERSTSPS